MKKNIIRTVCTVLCILMLTPILVSCSKEPYEYTLSEFITVPEDFSAITVTDAEIKEAVAKKIAAARLAKATAKPVTARGARVGDTLVISFTAHQIDSKKTEIPELSDSEATLILGNNKYPAELESFLVDKAVGEKYSVTVILPKDFTALELSGKQIIYNVEIKQISESPMPSYDDDFVQSVSSFTTVAEYEAYLYERMKEDLIFDKLLKKSNVKQYPISELQAYTTSFTKHYTEKADALRLTIEQYVAKKFFINMTDFHLKADNYAKELVKQEMVLYTLARRHGLELNDDEYEDGAQRYVAEYGLSSVSKLEAKFGTEYVRQTVLIDKVLTYLAAQITVAP